MSEAPFRIVDDSTVLTTIPYASIFGAAKAAAAQLGGALVIEDAAAGRLRYKYKYGISVAGIHVNVYFRQMPDGQTEVVVKGSVGDALDVVGAGKAKGRAVLNEMARMLQSGQPLPALQPVELVPATAAAPPIVGEAGRAHRGKTKVVATLLAFCLGGVGAHRFYLGAWGLGLVYIFLSVLGWAEGFPVGVCLAVAEAARFYFMAEANFDAKYNYAEVGPFTF